VTGNIIAGLNGCPSGSIPILYDVRAYVPITTYNNAMPTALKEFLSEFSIMEAAKNGMPRRGVVGKEIYIPFVSTHGINFSGNPIATSAVPDFNDFVQGMYPSSTVSGYVFRTLGAPVIPNSFDTNAYDEMYFVGTTPPVAMTTVNGLFGIIQAGLGTSTWTDYREDKPTLMFFTSILEESQLGPWDNTQNLKIDKVSNRFPLTSQALGMYPTLTCVFYAGLNATAAGYLNWYGEYSTLLGETATLDEMIIRYFQLFGHQRAGSGFAVDGYFTTRVCQGRGGGFFGGISNLLSGVTKAIPYIGGFVHSVTAPFASRESDQKLSRMIGEVTDNPLKYGHSIMLEMQHSGHLLNFM